MGVVESLLPIFLLIGLGAVLTARGFLTPEFLRSLNRLAYYVGMPGLLFVSVNTARPIDERPLRITLVLLGATLTSLVVGFFVARWLRIRATSVGTYVQSSFRGNLAFVGLPIVINFAHHRGAALGGDEIITLVAVAIAPIMISYNVLAVIVLVASHHKLSAESLRVVFKQVLTNPLVIAIVAGLAASHFSIRLPSPIETTVRIIGGLAIPAALFGVGGTMVNAPFRANLAPALAAGLTKVAFTPVVAWCLATALGLPALDTALATLLAASPCAAASFIMSVQLRGDGAIASSSIASSTLLSVATLAAALALMP